MLKKRIRSPELGFNQQFIPNNGEKKKALYLVGQDESQKDFKINQDEDFEEGMIFSLVN